MRNDDKEGLKSVGYSSRKPEPKATEITTKNNMDAKEVKRKGTTDKIEVVAVVLALFGFLGGLHGGLLVAVFGAIIVFAFVEGVLRILCGIPLFPPKPAKKVIPK